MIKFNKKNNKKEKRYKVKDIAKALGVSDHSVSGYFSNRKVSTKYGLTIDQIVEFAKSNRRGDICWKDVYELREILYEDYGIEVIEKDEEEGV